MLWGTQGYLWLPYDLTEVMNLIGERFKPKKYFLSKKIPYVIPSALLSSLPYYCHSFRITVIPSRLLSFLLNYYRFKYLSSWIALVPEGREKWPPEVAIYASFLKKSSKLYENIRSTKELPVGWAYHKRALNSVFSSKAKLRKDIFFLIHCPNVFTTPLQQWGFRQCLPFSCTVVWLAYRIYRQMLCFFSIRICI